MSSLSLSLLVFAALANGFALNLPRQTLVQNAYPLQPGWAPQTTPVPRPRHELHWRDDGGLTTTTRIFADNVCGYFDGAQDSPFACAADVDCVLQLPLDSGHYGHIGCMPRSESTIGTVYPETFCVDSDYDTATTDSLVMTCSGPGLPYCNNFWYPVEQIEYYACGTESFGISVYATVYTTYDGEDLLSEVRYFNTSSFLEVSAAASTNSASGKVTVTQVTAVPTTVVPPGYILPPSVITVTRDKATESATKSTSSTSQVSITTSDVVPSKDKSSQKSSPPIGAIVGGVIGGVGLLVIIGIALFVIRKKYYSKAASITQTPLTAYAGSSDNSPAGGKSEMDASEPIKSARNSTSEPKHYQSYQPVPTEPPYHDESSLRPESEVSHADSNAWLSVLSSNCRPNSPTTTYMSAMPTTIAEVEGSPVPPSIHVESIPTSPQEVEGPVPFSNHVESIMTCPQEVEGSGNQGLGIVTAPAIGGPPK